MSIEALNWAFNLAITGPKKAVLIALANYADCRGRVNRLSIQRVCLYSGWGERAVQFALQELSPPRPDPKAPLSNEPPSPSPIKSRDATGGRGRSSDYVLDLTYQAPNPSTEGGEEAPAEPVNGASYAPFEAERVHEAHPIAPPNPASDSPITPERVNLTSERVHEIHPLLKIPKKERKEGRECVVVRKRTPRAPIDPDWQPDEAGREYAARRNIPIASETESFRDYHLGKGTLIADCAATWRTWCRRAVEFAARDAARQRRQPEFRNGFLASIAEHGFEHASDDDNPVATLLRLNGGRVYGHG